MYKLSVTGLVSLFLLSGCGQKSLNCGAEGVKSELEKIIASELISYKLVAAYAWKKKRVPSDLAARLARVKKQQDLLWGGPDQLWSYDYMRNDRLQYYKAMCPRASTQEDFFKDRCRKALDSRRKELNEERENIYNEIYELARAVKMYFSDVRQESSSPEKLYCKANMSFEFIKLDTVLTHEVSYSLQFTTEEKLYIEIDYNSRLGFLQLPYYSDF